MIGLLIFPLDLIIKDMLINNIYGFLEYYKFMQIITEAKKE
jgi:hypothetical protein